MSDSEKKKPNRRDFIVTATTAAGAATALTGTGAGTGAGTGRLRSRQDGLRGLEEVEGQVAGYVPVHRVPSRRKSSTF